MRACSAEAEADADELAGGSGNDSEWEEYEIDGADDAMDEAAAIQQAKAVAAAFKSGASGARGSGGSGGGSGGRPLYSSRLFRYKTIKGLSFIP